MALSELRANWPVILAGLISAILIACTDLLLGMSRSPESWTTAEEVFPSAAATCLLFFFGFVGLWYALVGPLSRRNSMAETPTLAALGAFLFVVFLQFSAFGGIRKTMLSGIQQLATLSVLTAGVAIAHSIYVLLRKKKRQQFFLRACQACQAAPAAFIAAAALAFSFNPHRGSFSYIGIVLSIAAAATALVLFRVSAWKASVILGAITTAGVLAGSAALYVSDGFYTATTSEAPKGSHRVPRVILISIDSLRADALSAYNPNSPPTPHIDELASKSVRFRRAYGSAAWTLPSTVSLLTGLPSYAHQVYWMTSPLPDEVPTLARVMAAAGYRTAAVVDNPVLDPRLNLFNGFEEYASYPRPWAWSGDAVGRSGARSLRHRRNSIVATRKPLLEPLSTGCAATAIVISFCGFTTWIRMRLILLRLDFCRSGRRRRR